MIPLEPFSVVIDSPNLNSVFMRNPCYDYYTNYAVGLNAPVTSHILFLFIIIY